MVKNGLHYIFLNTYFKFPEELELTAENTDDSSHDADKMSLVLREQDRFLPIANVAKIMKKAIPESGKASYK